MNTPFQSWQNFFLREAIAWSSRSKISTTKVGCILVGRQKEPISVGYNGPPRGFPDDRIDSLSRDNLRSISTHAEANAVANAARLGVSTLGATSYVSAPPCSQCAALLINAGITEIIYCGDLHSDWLKSVELGRWLCTQCQVVSIHTSCPGEISL